MLCHCAWVFGTVVLETPFLCCTVKVCWLCGCVLSKSSLYPWLMLQRDEVLAVFYCMVVLAQHYQQHRKEKAEASCIPLEISFDRCSQTMPTLSTGNKMQDSFLGEYPNASRLCNSCKWRSPYLLLNSTIRNPAVNLQL